MAILSLDSKNEVFLLLDRILCLESAWGRLHGIVHSMVGTDGWRILRHIAFFMFDADFWRRLHGIGFLGVVGQKYALVSAGLYCVVRAEQKRRESGWRLICFLDYLEL